MKTIILLHGMGGPNPLNLIEKELSQYVNVIKPVMPGFSEQDGIISYKDDDYVEYVERVRKENGIEKFVVLGYSMGGRIALKFSFVQEILGKSDFVDYRSEVYKVGKKWVADMMNVPMIRKNFCGDIN